MNKQSEIPIPKSIVDDIVMVAGYRLGYEDGRRAGMVEGIEKVKDFLVEYGIIKQKELIPHKKPGHGPCCTCQTCGYCYDDEDCACNTNEILTGLAQLTSEQGDYGQE